MSMNDQKNILRNTISAVLKSISPEKRKSDSKKLCALLEKYPFFQNAQSILFFAPLPNEIDLWPLLEKVITGDRVVALPCLDAEKQLYAPRRIRNLQVEIISGQFGIREPAPGCISLPLDDLDLVLVPGVAFDDTGHRLGRGKGFYDRLLHNFKGMKAGIAFDEQVVETVPVEKTDVVMDYLVTPTRRIEIRK